jgi:hypothetical protein
MVDTRVFVVTEDGQEHEIIADSIEWRVQTNGEPATATIRLTPDQVNVAALATIEEVES